MNGLRKLAAIVAADVAGYSRLTGLDEEGTVERVRALRQEVIEPSTAQHRGRMVKTMGDGFLIDFASVVDAVRCAIDIQRGTGYQNAAIAIDRRIELRIGINVGDVVIEGDDLMGDGVNVAARLQGLAEPGAVWVSESAYQQVRDKLDVAFSDAGLQTLKNISRPVRAYRLQADKVQSTSVAALTLPDKPSIAVLAFDNMSGDPEQEYFTDGIVEDVITALSRFKQLFVISRNSSFTYKGKNVDVKQIGRELGVRYVLEGSVRKSGNRVRITGQLIDAKTGAHLWADRFDGELSEIFDLQDQVTASVVGAIIPKLDEAEIERSRRKPTESLEAYDYYLQGSALINGNSKEENSEALRLFGTAVALDPGFGLAYALAARCYIYRRANNLMIDRSRETAEAAWFARQSIALAKDDAVALSHVAHVLAYVVGDLDGAASACDRALALNTNVAVGWASSSFVKTVLGEPDVGFEHVARAMRLSPRDPRIGVFQQFAALACFFGGRHDEAVSWGQCALRENPNNHAYLRTCAASQAAAGHIDEARKTMARLCLLDPLRRISNLDDVTTGSTRPEDRQKYVDALRKAGLPE